jgi:ABC-type multidrug transport system ATPase subunit
MGSEIGQNEVDVKDLAVQVDHLTFGYGGPDILKDLNLRLPRGSRCLLVGANGAGKTTLLRILAGKRMVPGVVNILGVNAFVDAPKGVTYLGTEWASNPVVRSDLQVDYLLKTVGGDRWPERRDKLIEVLDVDTNWKMHQVSDGGFYGEPGSNAYTSMFLLAIFTRSKTSRATCNGSVGTMGNFAFG